MTEKTGSNCWEVLKQQILLVACWDLRNPPKKGDLGEMCWRHRKLVVV